MPMARNPYKMSSRQRFFVLKGTILAESPPAHCPSDQPPPPPPPSERAEELVAAVAVEQLVLVVVLVGDVGVGRDERVLVAD